MEGGRVCRGRDEDHSGGTSHRGSQAHVGKCRPEARALYQGDASAHADLYTSRVDRFLKRRNVSRREVRRETEKVLSRYPKSRRYEISDVAVEKMDGGKAVLTFRKDWDVRGRGQFAGAARQRLTLRNEAGSWKINGEEETKVYWARRR